VQAVAICGVTTAPVGAPIGSPVQWLASRLATCPHSRAIVTRPSCPPIGLAHPNRSGHDSAQHDRIGVQQAGCGRTVNHRMKRGLSPSDAAAAVDKSRTARTTRCE
jgi:hypothetical protein